MQNVELVQLLEQAHTARSNNQYALAAELYQRCLDETSPTTDPANHHIRLTAWEKSGELHRFNGRFDHARTSFQQYQAEAHTPLEHIKAYLYLSRLARQTGQADEANQLLQQAHTLADASGNPVGQTLVQLEQAIVQSQLGRMEESLVLLQKIIPALLRQGDRENQLRNFNWQGIAYARLGQTDKAIVAFTESVRLARLVDARAIAIMLGNLGQAYQELFNMDQALRYHQEGVQLAEQFHLTEALIDLQRNVGVDLIYLGRVEDGTAHLYQALAKSETAQDLEMRLQVLYSLALAEHTRGNVSLARTHAQTLLEMAQAQRMQTYTAEAYHALGLCAQAEGDLSLAEQYWQQASFTAHETGQRRLLWQIHAGLAEITPHPGLTAVHRRIATEVIEQIVYPIADERLRQQFLNAPAVRAVLSPG